MFLAYLRFVVRKLEIIYGKSNKIFVLLNNVLQHKITLCSELNTGNKPVNQPGCIALFTKSVPFCIKLTAGKS